VRTNAGPGKTRERTVRGYNHTFNYFVSYVFYVSHEERESWDVNGRRKVENEERKGDRMAGKAVGEWNGECEVGGRWVCGRAKQQDTLPSERWKAFQPESTLAQLCFLFGGGCGVAGRVGVRRGGWVERGIQSVGGW